MWKRLVLGLAKNALTQLLNEKSVQDQITSRAKNLNAAIDIPVLNEQQEQAILDNVINALKGVLLGL